MKPFFTPGARDLLKKLMSRKEEERLGSKEGAAEVKRHPFYADINWAKLALKQLPTPFTSLKEMVEEKEINNPASNLDSPFKPKSHYLDSYEGFAFTRASPPPDKLLFSPEKVPL